MPAYKNIKPCERLNNWEILAVTPTKMRSPDGYTKISQTLKEQQQKMSMSHKPWMYRFVCVACYPIYYMKWKWMISRSE